MRSEDPEERKKDQDQRARLLVPVTLVNACEDELEILARIADIKGRLEIGHLADRVRGRLGAELAALRKELTPAPDDHLHPFSVPRSCRQRVQHYVPWRRRLVHVLRNMVADAAKINQEPISGELLMSEQREIRKILDEVIQYNNLVMDGAAQKSCAAAALQLERTFRVRLTRHVNELVYLEPEVDAVGDRLRMGVKFPHHDLFVFNTGCLIRLLRSYPLSSLTQCKEEACQRYFIPGAEGRSRRRGVKFCSDACSRRWTNIRHRRSNSR